MKTKTNESKIPLHEAILLGSFIKKPRSGEYYFGSTYACALGMADAATGGTNEAIGDEVYDRIQDKWPWIRKYGKGSKRFKYPCECYTGSFVEEKDAAHDIIVHLFDDHRKKGKNHWSLERISDWVSRVDPTLKSKPTPEVEVAANGVPTGEIESRQDHARV